MQHARAIERRARQEVDVFIASNFPALVAAFRPEAERVVADVEARVEAVREAVDAYHDMHRRAVGLTAPTSGVDGRAVPGLDSAAELGRLLKNGWKLPAPVPEVDR